MARTYVPEVGNVVWLEFSLQAVLEQAGHRPALILSPASYNSKSGMMICCPMTTQIKGYPFEVVISKDPPSAVLSDQVKSLDWRARRTKRKGSVGAETLDEVRGKLRALIGA